MKKLDLRKFAWVIYPVVVTMSILASSTLLFSPGFWQNLFSTASVVQQATATANNLQSKLHALEAVNVPIETENLTYLLSILPATKQIPVLMSQLQSAAVDTGAILESYRFDAGDISSTESANASSDNLVLNVTYTVADLPALRTLLGNLANRTPLLAIHEVHYLGGRVNLKIDALWSPLAKLSASSADQPLPNVSNDMLRIKQQFANNVAVVGQASQAASESVSTNPF